jgi:hypothetical protein
MGVIILHPRIRPKPIPHRRDPKHRRKGNQAMGETTQRVKTPQTRDLMEEIILGMKGMDA